MHYKISFLKLCFNTNVIKILNPDCNCLRNFILLIFCIEFRYEGEFMEGWFHGRGMFWRADGMKYEGQFRGGRVWGLGE